MYQSDSCDQPSCILNTSTPQAAVEKLHELLIPLGLSGVVYSSTRLAEPLVAGSQAVQRWVAHFARENYFALDPLYSEAKKSVIPQVWHANQHRPCDTPAQIRIYRELAEFGIAKGFDLSIRDHEDEASLCFYYEDTLADLQRGMHLAQLGALYLHERVRQLSKAGTQTEKDDLTARERECFGLVREGLNYKQIAQRLRITERTVTFHLQNTKKKLGVSTLAQAIAVTNTQGKQAYQ